MSDGKRLPEGGNAMTARSIRFGLCLAVAVLLALHRGPLASFAAGQEPPAEPAPLLIEDEEWIAVFSEYLIAKLSEGLPGSESGASPVVEIGRGDVGFLVAQIALCIEAELRVNPGDRSATTNGCLLGEGIGDISAGAGAGFAWIIQAAIMEADTRVPPPLHPDDRAWADERAVGLRGSLEQAIRETPDAPPEAKDAVNFLVEAYRNCLYARLRDSGATFSPVGTRTGIRPNESDERRSIEAACLGLLVSEFLSLPAASQTETAPPTSDGTAPSPIQTLPPWLSPLPPMAFPAPLPSFPPPMMGQVPPAQLPPTPPDVMVTADKPSYSIGETMTICITTSVAGEARVNNVAGARRTELRVAQIDGRGCLTARAEAPAGQQCAEVEFVSAGGRDTAQACFTVTELATTPAAITSSSSTSPAPPSAPRVSLDGNYAGVGTTSNRTMPGFIPDAYVRVIRLRDWIGPTANQGPMTRGELRIDANGRVTGGTLRFEASKTLGAGASARTDYVLFEGSAVPTSNVLINQDTTGISPGLVFGVIEFEGPAQYCVGVPLNSPGCQKTTTDVTLHYVFRVAGAQPTGDLVLCDARAREACENSLVGVLRNR
jgi:hypothetical protein